MLYCALLSADCGSDCSVIYATAQPVHAQQVLGLTWHCSVSTVPVIIIIIVIFREVGEGVVGLFMTCAVPGTPSMLEL